MPAVDYATFADGSCSEFSISNANCVQRHQAAVLLSAQFRPSSSIEAVTGFGERPSSRAWLLLGRVDAEGRSRYPQPHANSRPPIH